MWMCNIFFIGYNLDAHNPHTPHSHHTHMRAHEIGMLSSLQCMDNAQYTERAHVCVTYFF